jgi:hypothetical protein
MITIYLKPYRHRCISRGITIGANKSLIDELFDNDLYEDHYNSEELYYLSKIWFEIVGLDLHGNEKHIGYITGYFVDMDKISDSIIVGNKQDVLFEFDANSHLTMLLYFLNNITIVKEYRTNEIERVAIELIKNALYEIYRYEVNSIVYSVGYTELDDDTSEFDNNTNKDELHFKRHIKNLENMGFKWLNKDNDIFMYYKY